VLSKRDVPASVQSSKEAGHQNAGQQRKYREEAARWHFSGVSIPNREPPQEKFQGEEKNSSSGRGDMGWEVLRGDEFWKSWTPQEGRRAVYVICCEGGKGRRKVARNAVV